MRKFPKTHWLDATCVGASTPLVLKIGRVKPLRVMATGWGNHKICGTDKYGFTTQHRMRTKSFCGFKNR